MKRKLLSVLLLAMLLFATGCGGSPESSGSESSQEAVYLEAGGASNTSFVYSAMVALSEVVNNNSDYIQINVQTTAGSTAHYQMFKDGNIQIGTGSGFADVQAWNGGTSAYPDPMQNQRTILVVSRNFQSILVHADSGINTMTDLNGKKIAVGNAGAPTSEIALGTLSSLGIKPLDTVFSTPTEMVDMFKDGLIDCMMYTSGAGNSLILDATNGIDAKFISLSDEEIQKCLDGDLKGKSNGDTMDHSIYSAIPEGEVIGIMNDYSSINVVAGMEDQIVYDILTLYWDNLESMRSGLKGMNGTPENIMLVNASVHPAAAKYYKDKFNIDVDPAVVIP
jgi:TRAP transporter TAXI family solute receptor